jgi:hypothetical protein
MGKQSGRARRKELNRFKVEKRRTQRELRQRQKGEGLKPLETTVALSNGKSEWETVGQEKEARQETDGGDDLWSADVCLSDGLSAGSQP